MYIPPEIRAHLEEVERRAGHLWKFLDVPGKQVAIARLEEQMGAATFWDSQKAAQKVISECNGYKTTVAPQVAFRLKIEDAKTLAELIAESPMAPPMPSLRSSGNWARPYSPRSPTSRSRPSSRVRTTNPMPS